MMKRLLKKKNLSFYAVDWYEATNNFSSTLCPILTSFYSYSKNEYILKYTFKDQVHYVRYVNGFPLTWIPNLNRNTIPLINSKNNLFFSSELTESLEKVQTINNMPVIYPDYSSVDVGIGKKWPKEVFSPYVDSTAWPPYSLVDSYNATTGLYYNLGFIVSKSATVCQPTWGTYYPAESGPLNDQIKAIRNLGGDVTVSFGGAANIPLHIVAPDVNSLYLQYKNFAIAYGLTRIDFDLEGPWIASAYNDANIKNSQALRQLQDYYKSQNKTIDVWFTLPILPTGLTPDGLNILQLALNAGVEISGVNAMTMDYGDSAAPNPEGNMGLYGIQAITSLKDQLNKLFAGSKTTAQLWSMIGTTPMIGVNDIQTEVFTIKDAQQTLQFAETNNIGMISMWSSNRDTAGGSGISQSNYEFALTFASY